MCQAYASFGNISIKRHHNFYPQIAESSAETNIYARTTYQLSGLAQNFPRWNQEETDNLNRQITRNRIVAVIKKFQQTKIQDQIASWVNSVKH